MYGKPGSMLGKKAWNNGLSIKTDKRVFSLGRKISVKMKHRFKTGELSNLGVKNPNFGKTPEQRTQEQLERYSKAAAFRVTHGKLSHRGIYKNNKTGTVCKFRSRWEERVMKCLDADSLVSFWEYEPLTIKTEDGLHRYTPDFVVHYVDGRQVLLEIKSDFSEKHPDFPSKKLSAEKYCQERNFGFQVWKSKEIQNYETRLGVLL